MAETDYDVVTDAPPSPASAIEDVLQDGMGHGLTSVDERPTFDQAWPHPPADHSGREAPVSGGEVEHNAFWAAHTALHDGKAAYVAPISGAPLPGGEFPKMLYKISDDGRSAVTVIVESAEEEKTQASAGFKTTQPKLPTR